MLQAAFEKCVGSLLMFMHGGQAVTKGQGLWSFTQEPISNTSIKIHLKASFITATHGGYPKDRVLGDSALEIEERLFHVLWNGLYAR